MRNMRKKQQQVDYVRPITTGHVEADMLGQCYIWLSERENSKNAQKTHRKKLKGYTFLSRSEVARLSSSGQKEPQTSFWRRIKSLISYSKRYGRKLASKMTQSKDYTPKYLQGVRKQNRNGK